MIFKNAPIAHSRIGRSPSLKYIVSFVNSVEFQSIVAELKKVPKEERDDFIGRIIINRRELKKRGVRIPDDLIIQRSKFGDEHYTLFCVSKYLTENDKKVTFTFDDDQQFQPTS